MCKPRATPPCLLSPGPCSDCTAHLSLPWRWTLSLPTRSLSTSSPWSVLLDIRVSRSGRCSCNRSAEIEADSKWKFPRWGTYEILGMLWWGPSGLWQFSRMRTCHSCNGCLVSFFSTASCRLRAPPTHPHDPINLSHACSPHSGVRPSNRPQA